MNTTADAPVKAAPGDPCTVVIFGAAGDLTKRKLLPALYNLKVHELLPAAYAVVGVARKALTHDVLGRMNAADLLQEVDVQRTRGIVKETKGFALLHATQHLAYHLGQLRYMAKLLQAGGA